MLKYILVAVAVLSILTGVYACGRDHEKQKTENVQLKAVVESEKKHEKKTKEIMSLDDIALRKRFCEWVRDDKSKCLQADIPIRD